MASSLLKVKKEVNCTLTGAPPDLLLTLHLDREDRAKGENWQLTFYNEMGSTSTTLLFNVNTREYVLLSFTVWEQKEGRRENTIKKLTNKLTNEWLRLSKQIYLKKERRACDPMERSNKKVFLRYRPLCLMKGKIGEETCMKTNIYSRDQKKYNDYASVI